MAAKLTPDEQQLVKQLNVLFSKALPAPQRNAAGTLASGIVRMRADAYTTDELTELFKKGDVPASALDTLSATGILVPKENGTWTLPEELPKAQRVTKKAKALVVENELATIESGVPAVTEPSQPPVLAPGASIEATPNPLPSRSTDKLALLRQVHVVRSHTQEATDTRTKIVKLDPRLWFNGWLLTSPDAYTLFEPEILALDAALKDSPSIGDGTLSLRELSYRIFGDEKFLSLGPKGLKLLRSLGIEDLLNYKRLPKLELMHHIPRRRQNMTIVVSENLDPWVNMRELMYGAGKSTILGVRVHGVVFGSGTVVVELHRLSDFIRSLGAKHVTVKYWGDIDRAGLGILNSLITMSEGQTGYTVEPFWEAYHLMLKKARERYKRPEDNETTDQQGVAIDGIELIEKDLTSAERSYLRKVIKGACIIPQEIVTIQDL